MFIRDFTAEDITSINVLLNKELGKCVEAYKLKSTISNMIDDGNYKIFIAEINDNIVGFTGVHFGLAFEIDSKVMRIIALAVKEEYQNCGIGTMLIKKAEEFAKENGASIVGVNSGLQRLAAHSFYEKQGFFKKGYSFVKNIELAD